MCSLATVNDYLTTNGSAVAVWSRKRSEGSQLKEISWFQAVSEEKRAADEQDAEPEAVTRPEQ